MGKVDLDAYRDTEPDKKLPAPPRQKHGRDQISIGKNSPGKRFLSNFVERDADDLKQYVIFEWLIPGIKNGILDLLSLMFFNEVRGRGRRRSKSYDREDYRSCYSYSGRSYDDDYRDRDRKRKTPQYDTSNSKFDYRNIVVQDRADAEDIVDMMCQRIDENGNVSVAEFIDILSDIFEDVGITSRFVDNNWGWTRKSDISCRRISRGWLIDVSPVVGLED